ncbi:MAG: TIGR03663 family protein, partial [Anaerolineaceae bacterium]|nr:TIGR03663 family protein [Anaerolineaceae bacterium]
MDMQHTVTGRDAWLDKPITELFPKITIEKLLMAIIIIMTLFSRFYILGERVMSHDEVNHVVPSYSLYQGNGYAHDPVTHGPMQFHLVALSYFLLGDSDFSARTPAALFSVATVLFVMLAFRSYLGRIGALIGGLLFTISPYLLFYGRYTRNEAFVALFAVLTVFLMLRYLERGENKYLYGLATVFALQFITKETSFIYLAQFLVFVAFVFIQDAVQHEWKRPSFKWMFVLFTIAAIILLLGAIAVEGVNAKAAPAAAESVAAVAPETQAAAVTLVPAALVVAGIAVALGVIAIALLILGVGWKKLTGVRSFDLLMLAGTLVLPQLTAFPVKMTGVNPIKYDDPVSFSRTAVFLVALLAISTVLGLVWKPRQWLISAGIFYSIYITFYTTFFTNGRGFFTGIIGSLGYWLEQQGVNRGSQPWYYYA